MTTSTEWRPLATLALPASGSSRLAMQAGLVLAGSMLIAIAAHIKIPFWPVPMTMQTFAIMVLAAAFGARLGTATVLLYLAEGAIGLPVFAGTPAKGIGLAYMMGPTGGYLVGFLAAAMLIGWLAERGWDRSIVRLGAAMFAGHVLVFAFGYAWLATLIGAEKAWTFGVAPFYAATLFKTALAALVLPAAWQLVRKG